MLADEIQFTVHRFMGRRALLVVIGLCGALMGSCGSDSGSSGALPDTGSQSGGASETTGTPVPATGSYATDLEPVTIGDWPYTPVFELFERPTLRLLQDPSPVPPPNTSLYWEMTVGGYTKLLEGPAGRDAPEQFLTAMLIFPLAEEVPGCSDNPELTANGMRPEGASEFFSLQIQQVAPIQLRCQDGNAQPYSFSLDDATAYTTKVNAGLADTPPSVLVWPASNSSCEALLTPDGKVEYSEQWSSGSC